MTVRTYTDPKDPTSIDLHNKIDLATGLRYLGRVWRDLATGRWLCLADVGALCVVEVRLVIGGEANDPPTSDPDAQPSLRIVDDPMTSTTSDPDIPP